MICSVAVACNVGQRCVSVRWFYRRASQAQAGEMVSSWTEQCLVAAPCSPSAVPAQGTLSLTVETEQQQRMRARDRARVAFALDGLASGRVREES